MSAPYPLHLTRPPPARFSTSQRVASPPARFQSQLTRDFYCRAKADEPAVEEEKKEEAPAAEEKEEEEVDEDVVGEPAPA